MTYMLKALLFFIMIFLNISSITALERQRIALVPFNPINVSKNDAELIYGSFETALMETDNFFVIDRNKIRTGLEEEDYSLFDCTNDQCAIELGRRLSAEQVLLGSLSHYSSSYILKIKMIDVSNGENIYSDNISTSSLDQMEEALELFVFKLAGLTHTEDEQLEIAREFSEVFIETTPSRADIYINGVKKGFSPDLISGVPLGRIRIAARKGDLYGERIVEITENVKQVQIELAETYGSLLIKSKDNIEVYLDNRLLGKPGSGSFENLSIGIHTLELKGQGLYWRDEVVIKGNESTVIEAQAKEYGAIEYNIPGGATAEIKGKIFREVVKGYGTLPVPVGDYLITVTGKNYEKQEGLRLTVPKGANISLKPDLHYSREYEYELFAGKLEEAERILNYGYRITNSDIKKFKDLKREIELSKHSFSELISRAESVIEKAVEIVGTEFLVESTEEYAEKRKRLEELLVRRQELEIKIQSRKLERKRKAIGGWTSFGLSLVSGGLAGLFYYLSNEAYKEYERSTTYEEAQKRQNQVELWDISTYSALGVSGLCLVISPILWLSSPSLKPLTDELVSVEREIALLEE